jgi:O-antigen ligase
LLFAGAVVATWLVAMLAVWSLMVAAVLIIGLGVVALAWLRPSYLMAVLVLGLPFHVFATRAMVGQLNLSSGTVSLFSLWKEGVMALLAVVLLLRRLAGRDRFPVPFYLFDLGLACVALLMSVYVLVTPRLGVGIFGLRNYLEPLVVFYLFRTMPVTRRDLRWLVAGIFLVTVIMATFGIYQALFWTFTDLYNWGFRNEDGTIPTAFYMAVVEREPRLRAVSTVTSPNELGLLLVLAILLAVTLLLQRQRPAWQRLLLTGIAGLAAICLLYTFSRSSLVGLIVAVIALTMLEPRLRNLGRTVLDAVRSPGTVLALILLAALLVVGAGRVGVISRFTRALDWRDPSAVGHLASYEKSIPFILTHPLGIGIGMAGPRALRFADELKIEHVESSYFQMMIEIGIPGTLFALGVLLLMIWTLHQQRGQLGEPFFEAVNLAAQAAWLGSMAAFAFLPLMQELQLMSYLWVVAAIPLRARAMIAVSHEDSY